MTSQHSFVRAFCTCLVFVHGSLPLCSPSWGASDDRRGHWYDAPLATLVDLLRVLVHTSWCECLHLIGYRIWIRTELCCTTQTAPARTADLGQRLCRVRLLSRLQCAQ